MYVDQLGNTPSEEEGAILRSFVGGVGGAVDSGIRVVDHRHEPMIY